MNPATLEYVKEALAKLPPGPYEVQWPNEQGGVFRLWGKQGTAPDFADGWAVPLVAAGTDTCMYALADLLTALAAVEKAADEYDFTKGERGTYYARARRGIQFELVSDAEAACRCRYVWHMWHTWKPCKNIGNPRYCKRCRRTAYMGEMGR